MKNLTQKILNVIAEIKPVEKDGVNSFHNYKYVSDAQIISMIRGLLVKHKLCIIPDQVECSQEKGIIVDGKETSSTTTVKINYLIIDVESGEQITVSTYGQGCDKGDKGVYKAATGSGKYLYLKLFKIPTEDDPEKESPSKASVICPPGVNIDAKYPIGAKPRAGKGISEKQVNLIAGRLSSIGLKTRGGREQFILDDLGKPEANSNQDVNEIIKAIELKKNKSNPHDIQEDVPF